MKCGGMLAAGGAAGRQAMKGSGPTFQDAIAALFNSMRETPEDSEKLSRLLRIYLDMAELQGGGVGGGRSYPKAMEVSDDCLSLMSEAFFETQG